MASARAFGQIMAKEGVALVYGGGEKGLMGATAQGVIENGGKVLGIIPEFLKTRELKETRDVELKGSVELVTTRNMHERKQMMFDRADAFVALPGGIGTLEELVEQLTWSQLGRHKKPILFANINGFWDPLCDLLDHMKTNGFIHSALNFEYELADKVEDIVPKLRAAAAKHSETEEEGERSLLAKM